MMQQNAFATDVRLRCNRPGCPRDYALDMGRSLRSHVSGYHWNDHHPNTNRKPNAIGMVLGVYSTHGDHAGVIEGAGGTSLFTVCLNMEQNALALSIQFDANAAAEIHYLIAVHRAQELLGIDQLPPLILKHWPPLHVFGPSASAAVLCAVVSLFTNRLCRSDTAVTARVEFGTDELFGVGLLAQKAWGARDAGLTRLVMATADQDAWAAVPADVREGLTPVFVGTGRELLDVMFKPLPWAVQ